MSTITPTLERYEFKYHGVSIWVEINYLTGKISLTENNGTPKKWLFSERGTEYMQGWRSIFVAMDAAVEHAAERLTAYQDKKTEEFALLLDDINEEKGHDPTRR